MTTTIYVNKLNETKVEDFLKLIGNTTYFKTNTSIPGVWEYTISISSSKWHFIIEEVLERFHEQLQH